MIIESWKENLKKLGFEKDKKYAVYHRDQGVLRQHIYESIQENRVWIQLGVGVIDPFNINQEHNENGIALSAYLLDDSVEFIMKNHSGWCKSQKNEGWEAFRAHGLSWFEEYSNLDCLIDYFETGWKDIRLQKVRWTLEQRRTYRHRKTIEKKSEKAKLPAIGVLTLEEKGLADRVGLDPNVLLEIKKKTKCRFETIEIVDDRECYFKVDSNVAEQAREFLSEKLTSLGFMVFFAESKPLVISKPILMGIYKTKDQFDILRIQETDGQNCHLNTESIIVQLIKWDKEFGIEIIGASNDWVEFKLKKLPKDIQTFASEVYKFCPDSVDQGAGTIERLIQIITEDKTLFLWWD